MPAQRYGGRARVGWRFIYLVLLLLLSSPALRGQSVDNASVTYYQQGEAALLSKEYDKAAALFERALREHPSFAAAARLLGQVRELQGRYLDAAAAYQKVLELDPLFSRAVYYHLGDVYYKMGRSKLALHYFREFETLQEIPIGRFGIRGEREYAEELVLLDRLPGNIRACEMLMDSVKFINVTKINNMGRLINSKNDDYFPFLSNDQSAVYFTRQYKDGDEDLYYSQRTKNGDWQAGTRVKSFNSDTPEGMTTLVRNGRQIYYTRCGRDTLGGTCDLWEALVSGTDISPGQNLGGPVNSGNWDSQAAISCDGRQLYFASNRPGGLGGSDIWYCEKLADGRWSLPRNLGAPINTPQDEEAPFISNDGQTLYFSSTGHLGQGEQDIFMSWRDERQGFWNTPINLGPPVNGPHRELGFHLSADGRTGYFASNRPGGEGGMDIYYFELADALYGKPVTFVEGYVLDSVLRTPVVTRVTIDGRNTISTDEQGRFFVCADAQEMLSLNVTTDNYHPYAREFPIPTWNNRQFYTLDLLLNPTLSFLKELEKNEDAEAPSAKEKTLLLSHSVFFGFDAAQLTPEEKERLQDLIAQIGSRKVVSFEIIGYADDIGSSSYNLILSEERAKEIAAYLLQYAQPEAAAIHIMGKGSVADDRSKELNRRVDVKIKVKE